MEQESETPILDEYFSAETSPLREQILRGQAIDEALQSNDKESLDIILRDCIENTDADGTPRPDAGNIDKLWETRGLTQKEILEVYGTCKRCADKTHAADLKKSIINVLFKRQLNNVTENNPEKYVVSDGFYDIKPGMEVSDEDKHKIYKETRKSNGQIYIGGIAMKTEQLFQDLQREVKQRKSTKADALYDLLFDYELDDGAVQSNGSEFTLKLGLITKNEAYDIVRNAKTRNEADLRLEALETRNKQEAGKTLRKLAVLDDKTCRNMNDYNYIFNEKLICRQPKLVDAAAAA